MIWNWFTNDVLTEKVKKILTIVLLLLSGILYVPAQEFKRDIELNTFVPKGQWIVGSSVSYSEHTEKNYQFLVLDGFNSDGYTFKVSPMLLYAFKDNLALGGRFTYGRTLFKMDGVTITLDEDNDFDIDNLYTLKHSYSGMAVLRNYINLGGSQRFGLYNDVQLQMGGSQSKMVSGSGESVTGTYATSTDLKIGVAPGMVAFINNYTAVEVSVGVLGFNFSKTRQTTDQVYIGERTMNSANFRINIFSIALGIAFYL
ncbi:MAG: hypothetical protein LUF04_05930 [Bacteroides sp.]|nr:hypothetical protein [Bacteroides sp.]